MKQWSLQDARGQLPWVKQQVERAAIHFDALRDAAAQLEEMDAQMPEQGDPAVADWMHLTDIMVAGSEALAAILEEFEARDIVVKDLQVGLVDFQSRLADRDVWLCWRLGESDITHYHGLEEGYAGRRPIPDLQSVP